jgi:hypothetical protein
MTPPAVTLVLVFMMCYSSSTIVPALMLVVIFIVFSPFI